MKLIVLAAALALAGCSKQDESKNAQAASGPSCADAIAKAVGAMPAGPGGGDVQTKLKDVMTKRCTEDKWPAAVVECYATQVTDMASMKKCREMIPGPEQQKLMGEIRSVMMGAGGAGPMHGAPAVPAGSAPGSAR